MNEQRSLVGEAEPAHMWLAPVMSHCHLGHGDVAAAAQATDFQSSSVSASG